MPDQEDHARVVPSSVESTVEYSFDDLARGPATSGETMTEQETGQEGTVR
jgi:hypothetical protein